MTDTTPQTDTPTTTAAEALPVGTPEQPEENDYVAAARDFDASIRAQAAKADTPKKKGGFFGEILHLIANGGSPRQLAQAALQEEGTHHPFEAITHTIVHGVSVLGHFHMAPSDWADSTPAERLEHIRETLYNAADATVARIESVALHHEPLPQTEASVEAPTDPAAAQS